MIDFYYYHNIKYSSIFNIMKLIKYNYLLKKTNIQQ